MAACAQRQQGQPLLLEVVADRGRPVSLQFADGSTQLLQQPIDMDAALAALAAACLQQQDGKDAAAAESGGGSAASSRHAQALVAALGPDDALAVPGTLHRVSVLHSGAGLVAGLTFRLGRHVPGAALLLADVLSGLKAALQADGTPGMQQQRGLLLLGRPGEAARQLPAAVACCSVRGAAVFWPPVLRASLLLRLCRCWQDDAAAQHCPPAEPGAGTGWPGPARDGGGHWRRDCRCAHAGQQCMHVWLLLPLSAAVPGAHLACACPVLARPACSGAGMAGRPDDAIGSTRVVTPATREQQAVVVLSAARHQPDVILVDELASSQVRQACWHSSSSSSLCCLPALSALGRRHSLAYCCTVVLCCAGRCRCVRCLAAGRAAGGWCCAHRPAQPAARQRAAAARGGRRGGCIRGAGGAVAWHGTLQQCAGAARQRQVWGEAGTLHSRAACLRGCSLRNASCRPRHPRTSPGTAAADACHSGVLHMDAQHSTCMLVAGGGGGQPSTQLRRRDAATGHVLVRFGSAEAAQAALDAADALAAIACGM